MKQDPPLVEDFEAVAGGHRLACRWLRPPAGAQGQPMVFLHEGLGSIAQWKDVPEAMVRRTGRAALVYERWGFGGSDPLHLPRPADYLEREAASLAELLDGLGIAAPILIGHSDGGTIALLFAADHPSRPTACVTEAAHVFVEEETLAGIRAAEAAWKTTDLKDRLARYHGDKTEAIFRGWTETWLRADFRDWDMTARLPEIACPLLVIQGADDEYGTEAQVEAIVEKSGGPAMPLILPDCGHVPHLQAREAVLEAIAGFIANYG